ncbi:MAG: hypothetical protein Q7R87_00905 [Nanoarchaeota archaeon]|nr:hypothetical protein [Nanoarchaeota archaeon]
MNRQPAFNLYPVPVNPFDAYAKSMRNNMGAALASQDGARFAESCLALGVSADQIPDLPLFMRGLADLEFEEASRPKTTQKPVVPSTTNRYEKRDRTDERYTKVLELNDDYGVNPRDMFNRPADKRRILMKAGYQSLFIKGGHNLPLIDACNERIGAAYERIYKSAEKWKAKQDAGGKK